MRRLTDGLYLLAGFPPFAINVYLMGGVLVDAGTRHAARRILRQARGHPVSALALTHAHPDHQGSCHAVCEALGFPSGAALPTPWRSRTPGSCSGGVTNGYERTGGEARTFLQDRYAPD